MIIGQSSADWKRSFPTGKLKPGQIIFRKKPFKWSEAGSVNIPASPEKRESSLKEVWAFIGSSTGMSEQEINSLTFTSRRKEPTPSSPEKSSGRPNQYSNNKSRPFPASGHSPQQPQVRLGSICPIDGHSRHRSQVC